MNTMDLIGKVLQAVVAVGVFAGVLVVLLLFLDREARGLRGLIGRIVAAAALLALTLASQLGLLDQIGWMTDAVRSAIVVIGWPLVASLAIGLALEAAPQRIRRPARLLVHLLAAVAIVATGLVVEAAGDTTKGAWPWAAALALSICALLGYASSRDDDSRPMLVFLVPAILLLTIGLIYPALRTALLAFTNAAGEFNGIDNFVWMFTQQTALVTLGNTIVWVILAPLLSTVIGLAYAVFIDKSRGEKIFKMLVFMPMAISFVGAGIIWKFMYAYRGPAQDQIGLVNQLIVGVGGDPQQILQNTPWNTLALIIVMIWIQTGFAMTVLSAAIKGVPTEQIEAANLDGASPWQRFTNVTVPGIRSSLVVVVTTISIATLKVFDIVRTMTGGNFDTSVVANEMYTQAFRAGEPGRGAALALILFMLVLPIVIYNVRVLNQQKEIR
jgi:ABC-type sugar transport system permease subunit